MKAQMAEIMAVQQQTIQALGGFVTKLNEKIESVDNFHMLITEIQQGHYHDESQLYSLCCVLAQLDKRTLEDDRKLNILRDALTQSEIISEDSISIQQYLMDILTLADNKVGVVYLELCNFRNSFPANLFAEMIETYHFLPKMEKMSKKKETLIQKLLDKYELDSSSEFSLADVSESFLENKLNSIVEISTLQISMQSNNENKNSTQTSDINETSACEASCDNPKNTDDVNNEPNTLHDKSEPTASDPPTNSENVAVSESSSNCTKDFGDVDRAEITDVINDLMEEINTFIDSEYENEDNELFEYNDSIECDPDDYNEDEFESKTKAKAACKKALNSAVEDAIEQYSDTKNELLSDTETYFAPLKEQILEFVIISFFKLYEDLVDGFCTGDTKEYMLLRYEEFKNNDSADGYKNWENMIESECNKQFSDNVAELSDDTNLLDTKELFEQCDIEDYTDEYAFDISDACSEIESILIEHIETMADELPDRIENSYISIKNIYVGKLIDWINSL